MKKAYISVARKGYMYIIYIILSSLIFLKGYGYREIYDITIFAFLSILLCRKNRYVELFPIILLLLAHVLIPGISLLWGYCALMFFMEKRTSQYTILSLILWLGEFFNIIPCSPWILMALVILFTPIICLSRRYVKWIIITCSTFAVIFTIFSMPCWDTKTYAEKYIKSVFSPSDVFCKITNTDYLDSLQSINSKTKIIRSLPFYTKIPTSQPGIFIFEVDYKGEFEDVNPNVWQQPISWYDNQLIGNQYYLESIRHDGGLYSNKGITLEKGNGHIQLAYIKSFTQGIPLIVKHNEVLYLHDSDYSSSFLANYQRCFLNELVGNGDRPNYIRLLNILFAIVICMECYIGFKNKHKYEVLLLPFICIVLYQAYFRPIIGDIRIVGKITNSHENNKFDGVVKKIVFADYNYTIGDTKTKILVVQKGRKASVKTEKFVLAEEGCTISIGGEILKVNNNPIGNINGVVDARQWLYKGKLYDGIININDITLIATGSPALQQWKDLLR